MAHHVDDARGSRAATPRTRSRSCRWPPRDRWTRARWWRRRTARGHFLNERGMRNWKRYTPWSPPWPSKGGRGKKRRGRRGAARARPEGGRPEGTRRDERTRIHRAAPCVHRREAANGLHLPGEYDTPPRLDSRALARRVRGVGPGAPPQNPSKTSSPGIFFFLLRTPPPKNPPPRRSSSAPRTSPSNASPGCGASISYSSKHAKSRADDNRGVHGALARRARTASQSTPPPPSSRVRTSFPPPVLDPLDPLTHAWSLTSSTPRRPQPSLLVSSG